MTDPEELLEIFDPAGRRTGVAKARGPIHRDGDWHLAFYCWIVRWGAPGPELVLQKRSAVKDVFPGRFDASAAGHVRFGETRAEMVREIDEELGLVVQESELLRRPWHRQEHQHQNGLIDREHHELNLYRCDLPLERYRPSPLEVSGLTAVSAVELADLVDGRREAIETTLVCHDASGRAERRALRLTQADLVPYDEGYHRRLAEWAAELVAGGGSG